MATTGGIDSGEAWRIAIVSLIILSISFGSPYITTVALKTIAAELGGERSIPSGANALAWLGTGVGGLMMGLIAERIGIRATVIVGALSVALGLVLSSGGTAWQLYVGHGLFIGLIGNGAINAPLYVYVSRWFETRRGTASGRSPCGVGARRWSASAS
jgi:MFS family permease